MPRRSAIDDRPRVEVADRAQWREWLQREGGSSAGVWLAVGKKGNRVTTLTYEDAVLEALSFGWIDSVTRSLDADRYLQLFTPRKRGGTWSRSNKERVGQLIAEELMTPAGQAAIDAAKADGSWNSLDDIDSLTVPDDLVAALAAAPGAQAGFASLTESARKFALYWISTAKRPETRARRIAETVEAARQGKGPR